MCLLNVALVLAWLLTSCAPWCTLLNHSESQFTHLQNVDNNAPVPFTLPSPPLSKELNGYWGGGEGGDTDTVLVLENTSLRQSICLILENMDTATNELWWLNREISPRSSKDP